jgi:hypothetical protein
MRIKDFMICVALVLLISPSVHGQSLPKVRAAYTSIGIQFDPVTS